MKWGKSLFLREGKRYDEPFELKQKLHSAIYILESEISGLFVRLCKFPAGLFMFCIIFISFLLSV